MKPLTRRQPDRRDRLHVLTPTTRTPGFGLRARAAVPDHFHQGQGTSHAITALWRRPLRTVLMNLVLLLIIVLVLVAVLPTWPYSSGWGYYPSGGLGLVLLILLVLVLMGRV